MNDLLRTAIKQDSMQPRELVSIGQKKGAFRLPVGYLNRGSLVGAMIAPPMITPKTNIISTAMTAFSGMLPLCISTMKDKNIMSTIALLGPSKNSLSILDILFPYKKMGSLSAPLVGLGLDLSYKIFK